MDLNRRFILKGLALTGFAATTPGFASSNILSDRVNSLKINANLPIVALIDGLPDESAFLAGVRFAQQQQHSTYSLVVQRCDLGLGFLRSLHALLHSGKPTQAAGLVDDASAAIIVNLVRSAGVRMHWLGQHAVSAEHSRHNILTADSEHDLGPRLAQQLNARGAGFSFTEQPVAGSDSLRRMAFTTTRQTPQNGNWAASLGFVLASLGVNPIGQPAWTNNNAVLTPLLGNFVSFSFKT
jgi:hypothetical protein